MVALQQFKVLVFNPNISTSITESFVSVLFKLDLPNIKYTYWTCPTGPAIIKTQAEMYESANHCIPLLLKIAHNYDGFLGACYADHPVVRLLQSYMHSKPVVGIFDASIHAAIQLVKPSLKFGIVTTGMPFEHLLTEGVTHLLKATRDEASSKQFAGVVASGIGMSDLASTSRAIAKEKIMMATSNLLQSANIDVICVGGVILSGMECWIREACENELGLEMGRKVKIIDQLAAGALVLDAILRHDTVVDFGPALR